jgi:hypothetical protein
MLERKILLNLDGILVLKVGAETFILFVSQLIWPMVDSYYVSLLFTVSMTIASEGGLATIEATQIIKRI